MGILHFWIYTPKEIPDILTDLAKMFKVRDFFHDTENVWEYAEGKSKTLNARINVSREYDRENFPEEKPLHIALIIKKTRKKQMRIDKLGSKLHKHFKAVIHYGTLRHIEGSSYEFITSRTFSGSQHELL